MTLRAYWWDPRRQAGTLARELGKHGPAWLSLIRSQPKMQNFGDVVNPLILRELTGRQIEWSALGQEDVVCVGSVVNAYVRFGGKGFVMGSGVREPTPAVRSVPTKRVLGLRGRDSAAAMALDEQFVVGDPGLLISQIVPAAMGGTPAPVFVPHFTMPGSARGRRLLRSLASYGYEIVLPNSDPGVVAQRVSGASSVVATSLHALVFADAYGVPCARLEIPWLNEPLFKFGDYRSVFGSGLASVNLDQVQRPAVVNQVAEKEHELVAERLGDVLERIYSAAQPLRS